MKNLVTKSCLFQYPDGAMILRDGKIIAFAGPVKSDSTVVLFYKVGFDDKLRIEGELEIEDKPHREGTSQFSPYAKFISHLKLVFKKQIGRAHV